jgi:MGT family glycosyltransferase
LRICLTTFGSFGDLHPTLGLARELRSRGHLPVIATSPVYREIVEGEGIAFAPVRPDLDPDDRELLTRVMDRKKGTEVLFEFLMPAIRDSYLDLFAATEGADLLVSHPVTYAGPVVAEVRRMRWASVVLSPISFFSKYDFPVMPPAPGLVRLTSASPAFAGIFAGLAKVLSRKWIRPLAALRRELGLSTRAHPIFEAQHSAELVLAMFSRLLGSPQPDWPPNAVVTGAVRYDGGGETALPEDLCTFLESGEPPIVFTLGSAAVGAAGSFYEESLRAAVALGRRAVLVTGRHPENRPSGVLPDDVHVTEYAPYSQLFPRAALVVHQGGIGTTHQAMAAGHPMIVVPFSHDQPDNAHRVAKLGISRTIFPAAYRASRVARDLEVLLDSPDVRRRAAKVGETVRKENGAAAACDAIERLFAA